MPVPILSAPDAGRLPAALHLDGLSRETTKMIEITAVHMANGASHQHIASVRWVNPSNANVGQTERGAMVSWLQDNGNRAVVQSGQRQVEVGVVDANPPYLRTYADGVWTDNLLALPRF
jgi:catechol-2,3-dioxygenase